jgi:CSLREA domain-containing protein
VLVVGFIVALQVTPAFAATITVTSTADPNPPVVDGNCTLREAVRAANDNIAVDACAAGDPGADTIQFGVTGTVTLNATLGQLVVLDSPLTIQATTGGTVFVSGGNSRRVFLVGNDAAIDTISRELTLRNIGVINGRGVGNVGGTGTLDGGCIYVATNSIVRLDGSVVRNCQTTGTGVGGGIFAASGSAATVGSQIILTNSSTLRNNSSTVSGGGIFMTTGEVQVINGACVRDNTSGGFGGGIYMAKDSHLRVGNPGLGFIVSNRASGGGGVYLEAINAFSGNGARFYNNQLNAGNLGSAWLSFGGDTGVHPNGTAGRFCTNCCIVGNATEYAVYQDENVLGTDWRNNWWGSNWGPLIYDLDPSQSAPPEIGSAVSNGDGIRGLGIITPGSAVNVGLTSSGTWDTAPTGNWLYSSSAPATGVTPNPPPNTAPSDCRNFYCSDVSSQGQARTCNNPTTCGLTW